VSYPLGITVIALYGLGDQFAMATICLMQWMALTKSILPLMPLLWSHGQRRYEFEASRACIVNKSNFHWFSNRRDQQFENSLHQNVMSEWRYPNYAERAVEAV